VLGHRLLTLATTCFLLECGFGPRSGRIRIFYQFDLLEHKGGLSGWLRRVNSNAQKMRPNLLERDDGGH
jgi:hypothetical protein